MRSSRRRSRRVRRRPGPGADLPDLERPPTGRVSLADGQVTYTPEPNYNGPASFAYTVCDNGTTNGAIDSKCAQDTAYVTVTSVDDDPPVVVPTIPTKSVQYSDPITPLVFSATDLDSAGSTLAATRSWKLSSGGGRAAGRARRVCGAAHRRRQPGGPLMRVGRGGGGSSHASAPGRKPRPSPARGRPVRGPCFASGRVMLLHGKRAHHRARAEARVRGLRPHSDAAPPARLQAAPAAARSPLRGPRAR